MHGMNIKIYRSFFFYLDVLWKLPDKVFGNKADAFDAPRGQIVIPPQKETLNAFELLKVKQQHTDIVCHWGSHCWTPIDR